MRQLVLSLIGILASVATQASGLVTAEYTLVSAAAAQNGYQMSVNVRLKNLSTQNITAMRLRPIDNVLTDRDTDASLSAHNLIAESEQNIEWTLRTSATPDSIAAMPYVTWIAQVQFDDGATSDITIIGEPEKLRRP